MDPKPFIFVLHTRASFMSKSQESNGQREAVSTTVLLLKLFSLCVINVDEDILLPRDAMLARYMPRPVSVRLTHAGVVSKRFNRSSCSR